MEVNPPADGAGRVGPYPADIRTLTSLRYLAAIWVVLFHWTAYFPDTVLATTPLIREGYLGVDFFFILSGFILSHVYLQRQAEGRLDYWNFVSRRIARIYPMHLVTLVGMIAFGVLAHRLGLSFAGPWAPDEFFALGPGEVPREVMAQLLLIHAWGASDGLHFNAPSWSISAELFAYLMFPLFTFGLNRVAKRPGIALAGVVGFILIFAFAVGVGAKRQLFEMSWNIGVLRIIPDFLFGIALYRFGSIWSAGARAARIGLAVTTVALIALVALQAPIVLVVLALGLVILLCADAERAGFLAPIRGDFAVLLGEVSYSVYILHFPFGIAFYGLLLKTQLSGGLVWAVALLIVGSIGVTLLSWLSHRLIEIPARNRLNKGASAVMARWP